MDYETCIYQEGYHKGYQQALCDIRARIKCDKCPVSNDVEYDNTYKEGLDRVLRVIDHYIEDGK